MTDRVDSASGLQDQMDEQTGALDPTSSEVAEEPISFTIRVHGSAGDCLSFEIDDKGVSI